MGMVVKNTVIVMALYDIGRDNWDIYNLSYDVYLSWMRNSLSLDSHFVIYTEPKFYDTILKYRKEYDPELKKTIFVLTPLEELDCYKKYNQRLEVLMGNDEFKKKDHHKVPEMSKPLYNVVMFNKLYFLKNTKDSKYFDCDLLIWADAGGLRNEIYNYENESWPSLEKINKLDSNKITFFSHTSDFNIEDKEFHSISQVRNIQGTSFFVPVHMIDDLLVEFNETIEESLLQNYIGSDEKIFDITYCKNKDKYNLIQCTWRTYFELFKNKSEESLIDTKNVFLDLGTHECQGLDYFINHELKMDNNWEIHTFEPNPLIDVDQCVKNFHNKNITVHHKAVWIKNGKVIFKQYGDNGTSQGSLLKESNGGKSYNDYYGELEVDSIDFYEFINSLGENVNIYIKMDIEFSEYEVLKHMIDSGWNKNIKKIWIAWHNISDNNININPQDISEKIEFNNTEIINWH